MSFRSHRQNPFHTPATSTIPLTGRFSAEIESITMGRKTTVEFLVVKGSSGSRPLLSRDTGMKLRVLHITKDIQTKHDVIDNIVKTDRYSKLIKEYRDVFSGLGKHKGIRAKFLVDETVKPVVLRQRKIPFNLEKMARKEEDRLLELGVIEDVPCDQATTWYTNPVIAPKPHNPEKIRYCSDMRIPNTAIKRPVTEALTVEDIKAKLHGAKLFSVMDMNESYHQLELDEASRHLTTFYGTRGKLRYKRLNYGTISAQDIFDRAMDDTCEGLTGALHIRDDFIIYGQDDDAHDGALERFLQRFRECGLTLNPNKCKFHMTEIEFF